MNGFLWLGVASTVVLVTAVVLDGVLDVFDLDLDIDGIAGEWLSVPVIAAFLGAFGFAAGAVVGSLGPVALLIGLLVGAAFAFGATRLTRAAANMDTDRTDAAADLLASFGRIVTPPDGTRYGEVLLRRPGGPVKVACIAERHLPAGTEVVVVDVTSSTLVTVTPFDPGTGPIAPL